MSITTTERSGQRPAERVARLGLPAVLTAGGLAGMFYIRSVSPYSAGGYPLCPIYALTGLYCPGCGTARCLHSLLNGDLAAAFAANPLLPPLLLVLAVGFGRWVWLRWQGRRFVFNPPDWVPIAFGVATLAYAIARNLPGLEFLRP
ncbi:MAG: DUF2752 domain-containing protein [Intrasporangiaceae bacterium]|nr:DUF2752 domain-containing protein [Intrasporangiaceae bacterium]